MFHKISYFICVRKRGFAYLKQKTKKKKTCENIKYIKIVNILDIESTCLEVYIFRLDR
jgi:hypothetical protein